MRPATFDELVRLRDFLNDVRRDALGRETLLPLVPERIDAIGKLLDELLVDSSASETTQPFEGDPR